MRELSTDFMNDLKNEDGILYPILKRVRDDDTLQLAIRNGYINVYYRGGSIIKVQRNKKVYTASFDVKYNVSGNEEIRWPLAISDSVHSQEWVDLFPRLKMEMDLYPRIKNKHSMEREFQQIIARVNNRSSVANDTDYFITDIELAYKRSRFDMTAIKWLSTSSARKNGTRCTPAFFEVKYGDKALNGESGMIKHLDDFSRFMEEGYKDYLDNLANQFNTLRKLKLIECTTNQNVCFSTANKPEFIFLIANHKQTSRKLKDQLKKLTPSEEFDLKFSVANFMGYGLYEANMLSLAEFQKLLYLNEPRH